jgi:hypothetical protein
VKNVIDEKIELIKKLKNVFNGDVLQNDLSEETQNDFVDKVDEDEFYEYAYNELINNFSKIEYENNEELDESHMNTPLHAACDYYLNTSFF